MTKNPVANALAALLYIILVSSVMYFGSNFAEPEDSVLAPIAVLSLFTFSAGVMGYIFLSQPIQLYLDGKKKEAVNLFIKTLAVFGGLTLLGLALLFSGIIG
jgi:hypothetical protein